MVDIEKAKPTFKERDVLVKVQAISVNPVDTKVRKNSSEANNRILGWDAVGEIIEVGSKVTSFKVGDSVWYAGDLTEMVVMLSFKQSMNELSVLNQLQYLMQKQQHCH